jgi:hypothetical protein
MTEAQRIAEESRQAAMMYGGLALSRLAVHTEAEAAEYTADADINLVALAHQAMAAI